MYCFDIGLALRNLGISATRLADMLGISYHDMSLILKGKRKVSDEILGKLYRLFGSKIFLAQCTHNVYKL